MKERHRQIKYIYTVAMSVCQGCKKQIPQTGEFKQQKLTFSQYASTFFPVLSIAITFVFVLYKIVCFLVLKLHKCPQVTRMLIFQSMNATHGQAKKQFNSKCRGDVREYSTVRMSENYFLHKSNKNIAKLSELTFAELWKLNKSFFQSEELAESP